MKSALIALLALVAVVALAAPAKPGPVSLSGRCHCGAVTYKAETPVIKCSYCDCAGCRHATGALRAPYVTIKADALKVEGKVKTFRAKSEARCDCHGTWQSCAACGSPLFWKPDKGDQLDILAGTLDDPAVFKPEK
jgi:hypothetical protein